MSKTANPDYPIHDLLQRRWSPRAFADKPVSDEDLRSILEAARWAASCFNEQPWRYIVARRENREELEAMLACLVSKNQQWAVSAPVLMLSVARDTFTRNDKPNRHALHDVGMASAQLTVQAMALGLWVHQMAGFDSDKARETYQIPDGFTPVAALAVGHLGDPASLPESFRDGEVSERQRRPQAEIVFSGRWGEAL